MFSLVWPKPAFSPLCTKARSGFPSARRGVLEKRYLKDEHISDVNDLQGQSCPECGEALVFQEGCLICPGCGFSRCG